MEEKPEMQSGPGAPEELQELLRDIAQGRQLLADSKALLDEQMTLYLNNVGQLIESAARLIAAINRMSGEVQEQILASHAAIESARLTLGGGDSGAVPPFSAAASDDPPPSSGPEPPGPLKGD